MGRVRVGVSGWNYAEWRSDFYPESVRRSDELSYVGDHFATVEVNGTFYGLLKPVTFRRWFSAVPDDFVFAVKGSRFITHNKKLAGVEPALANFFASGLLELDHKLGPILWQLPANLHFDAARIEAFLDLLPRDTAAAASLARNHDERIAEAAFGRGANHRVRHVLEARHPSFSCEAMVSIARRCGVALAFSHAAEWPYREEITAGFVYVRLHGPTRLYASPYGDAALQRWADRIEQWRSGSQPDDALRITTYLPPPRNERDVYVYFNNDAGGYAPREAASLQSRLRRRG